jgi:L-aspartate oxidase
MIKTDYLIIGSGVSGLSLALKACKIGDVALITKREMSDSATQKAQGGIACVMDKSDTFSSHIKDTIAAGAGLCNEKMVAAMVKEGGARLKELIDLGVNFTKDKSSDCGYELGLEAAHSHRRIFHVGDMTGQEIEKVLINNTLVGKNIKIYQNHMAVDLILDDKGKCRGAFVFDSVKNIVETFIAKVIVLACGGAGKTYLYTTNPNVATGDGIAMAYRAGADIANMEFVQFHPTCFYNHIEKSFLISEAVRGEGGILRLKNGEPFMEKYHPKKELAPRDIVSRAIDAELKRSGDDFVYLDITAQKSDFIIKRFPVIYAKCKEYNIDITKDMIPVIPAAHFLCGGVKIDENGNTSVKNLFAVGETACSGVHGANRLASNSLLEGLVYADRVFNYSKKIIKESFDNFEIKNFTGAKKIKSDKYDLKENWKAIRHLSWSHLGITRSNKMLFEAREKIKKIKNKADENFLKAQLNIDVLELRNIIYMAAIIAHCAILRKESRGTHFNIDYPDLLAEAKDTIINIGKKA